MTAIASHFMFRPLQQLVRRDRQLPDASARSVEHGIGNRRRYADHPELAHS
jgi:hypothetical protein